MLAGGRLGVEGEGAERAGGGRHPGGVPGGGSWSAAVPAPVKPAAGGAARLPVDAGGEGGLGGRGGEWGAGVGPSGRGKSTLLNRVAGRDRPSSGTVTVAGGRVDRLNETGSAR
ncbi:hypothetical protein VM98_35115 [Streptomyces rubellomurinus subsp. indigoferus]|nr:hypothetical protein VM98_35115 [Streptomyces rubellomurinus subsp. indigoferus]